MKFAELLMTRKRLLTLTRTETQIGLWLQPQESRKDISGQRTYSQRFRVNLEDERKIHSQTKKVRKMSIVRFGKILNPRRLWSYNVKNRLENLNIEEKMDMGNNPAEYINYHLGMLHTRQSITMATRVLIEFCVFLKLALLPFAWKLELLRFLLMRRFIEVRKMKGRTPVRSNLVQWVQYIMYEGLSLGSYKFGAN